MRRPAHRLCSVASAAVLLACCSASQPPQPKTDATKEASHGQIVVGDMLGGKMIKYVRPVYPKEARKAQIQGVVKLRALVAKTGEVSEIVVLSGDPALVPAAAGAVKQWRYAPTYLNNEPVEVRTTIHVPFTLNQ
jgi:TonB family protein